MPQATVWRGSTSSGLPASGDDAIVAEAVRLVDAGRTVSVVTSDRELARRVTDAGATARGARWLLDQLD